jgi:hypothetical protein
MFHLLTLPFRIVFGVFFGLLALPFALLALPFALIGLVLFLPFLLFRFLFRAALAMIVLPILLLVGAVVCAALLFAAGVAILLPLSPFLLLGLLVWALTRNSRAAIATQG